LASHQQAIGNPSASDAQAMRNRLASDAQAIGMASARFRSAFHHDFTS
jgi:hypothetical protein